MSNDYFLTSEFFAAFIARLDLKASVSQTFARAPAFLLSLARELRSKSRGN